MVAAIPLSIVFPLSLILAVNGNGYNHGDANKPLNRQKCILIQGFRMVPREGTNIDRSRKPGLLSEISILNLQENGRPTPRQESNRVTFPLIPDKSTEKRDGRVWETGSAMARLFMVNIYVDADAGLGKDEFENILSFGNASLRRKAD